MADAVSRLVARVDDDRPFDANRAELELLWVEAADQRLRQQRSRIPVLDRLASAVGVSAITSLDDLVPLLFDHTVYKSPPLPRPRGGARRRGPARGRERPPQHRLGQP